MKTAEAAGSRRAARRGTSAAGDATRAAAAAAPGNATLAALLASGVVRARLRVSEARDPLEHDADRMAEAALRASTVAPQCDGSCGGTCPACRRRKAQLLQRQPAGNRPASAITPPASAAAILAPLGAGRALDAGPRATLERGFATSFAHVRVHADARAAESARTVDARAYTLGDHVVFGEGEYAPGTPAGMQLLAHELAHTLQQRGGAPAGLMRQPRRRTAPQDSSECAAVASGLWIERVVVDQETPQRVTIRWSDGTEESDSCSTGKGHCCVEPEAVGGGVTGAACSESGSQMGGSNCTAIGERRVNQRIRTTAGGVQFWTEFVPSPRSIALHEYTPVDGTPLSHGCVRLHHEMAVKIWCGARENRTRVRVQGLARPRCDHPALQRELLGDFLTASRPRDGEQLDARERRHVRTERAQLRSALGVDEAGLTGRIEELETATGGFARGTAREARTTLAAVAGEIPRCLPTLTTEEQRLGPAAAASPTFPQEVLATSGFDRFAPALRRAFMRTRTAAGARTVVRDHGRALWEAARARARGSRRTAPDVDDRPLYWARLTMTRILREATPRWMARLDPDDDRRTRADLLLRFEQASRGMDTAIFERARGVRRLVVTGFDPFGLASEVRTSNPSGAAVLALDGRTVTGPGGERARVEGAIFPVRYADFDQGVLERFMTPFITGPRPADLIVTISRGSSVDEELEHYAGRRRSTDTFRENLGLTSGGTRARPIVPPGMGPGAEFLRTTTSGRTRAAMRGAVLRTGVLPGETDVEALPGGLGTTPVSMPGRDAVRDQPIAVAGAGGGFLSNEIFYRSVRLARTEGEEGREVPVIHLHTRFLAMTGSGMGDAAFAAERDSIVRTVEAMLTEALPTL